MLAAKYHNLSEKYITDLPVGSTNDLPDTWILWSDLRVVALGPDCLPREP